MNKLVIPGAEEKVPNMEICRLCLSLTETKINIFTEDFSKMIEILTCLELKPDDGISQISCLKCAREVKLAFLVRRRILQSYKVLAHKTNIITPSVHRSANEATSKANLERLNDIFVSSPPQLKRPFRQLQSIMESSNINTTKFDHDESASLDFNSPEESNIDTGQGNSNLGSVNISAERKIFSNGSNAQTPINLQISLSETTSEKIQKLKLAMNKKYSDMLNSYQQKINSLKLVPTKDQISISKVTTKTTIPENVNNKSKSLLVQHKRNNTIKMYCNSCKIKFPNRISYNNHMAGHRQKPCPVCTKQIRTVYMKKHMTIHEDAPAMCEVCGITCKNQVSLRMHFFYYHKSNLSVCEDCGRSFKTRTKLLYHQRKDHSKERNYKCETCGKGFFTKLYLTKHINMKHMKMRPHICEYCGKGFSGRHALRTHIRQHTNEAPYQCNYCCERFRQRVSLRGHLKSRHKIEEENNFFCDTCGKGFATNVALDVHSRLHAEIKCPWCSDTFAEKTYLEHHISATHPDVEYQEVEADVGWLNV